jgi:2-dehydro-3-deoxyphosphogluconate aldolase / (4S)-4-hydroxy-2-oxoglutarate aldolase
MTDSTYTPLSGPQDTTSAIATIGVVAILRASTAQHLEAVAETLIQAGISAIEVTLTVPGALATIARLSKTYGHGALIGAGTVITADQAEACIDAGAIFLVSPTASLDVIAAARIAGVAVYPGAFTPTEILATHRAGASAVKLFPASAVGPRFIADIHGPLPDIAIIPTGGIAIDDVEMWIKAGAAAVGLGGALLGDAGTRGADEGLAARARRALDGVAAARDVR